jgi:hypothetical protein
VERFTTLLSVGKNLSSVVLSLREPHLATLSPPPNHASNYCLKVKCRTESLGTASLPRCAG